MLRAKSFQKGFRAVAGARRVMSANIMTAALSRTRAIGARNIAVMMPNFSVSQQMSARNFSSFKDRYDGHVAERAQLAIAPKALDAAQVTELVELLQNPPKGEEKFLVDLLANRIPPGVDEAAYVKAGFLSAVAKGKTKSPLVSKEYATELLGTMQVSAFLCYYILE